MTTLPLIPSVAMGAYERIVGYTDDELAEQGGWTGIMNADDLCAAEHIVEQLNAGVPTVHKYRIQNKHGETRWLRDHSSPIMEDGKLARLVGGVKDITETKALESQLLQAQKHEAIAHLVGAVAHDFNNLLCVVMASTELMSSDSTKINREGLTAEILVACDRATELTRSLLAFTRKDLPVSKTVSLLDTVRDSTGLVQRAVGEQIKIHVQGSHGLNDKIEIDPGHLQLVLLNLATNARTAMENRGELRISVADVDSHAIDLPDMDAKQSVRLDIADTGGGISEENIHRVFEPFFTTKPNGEGFGIGLATCQQIVENAGGAIHVNSRLGHGTTFSIYLPTVNSPVSKISMPAGKFAVGGKERILLVEDDSDVRRISARTLQSFGYDVSAVDSAWAAREAVANKKYDLLVVDVRLPDGDGCSLIRELRESAPALSALLISGYLDEEVRQRIRSYGHRVLPKPFNATALARSVRATLHAISPRETR